MVICTDTSFLFSLYGNDSKTSDAVSCSARNQEMIWVTSLNRFELINALRYAECRRSIGAGDSHRFAADFLNDLRGERLVERFCDLAEILSEASRLSLVHTLTGGHRGFDLLHVAAAKIMGATYFLTFEANQKRLAESEDLIVPF